MVNRIKSITIGADPELFLKKNGEIITAEGLIGGTKQVPKLISDKGHAVQEDNIMVEYNIPPSNTVEDFISNNNYVLNYLESIAALNGSELCFLASAEINPIYLKTEQAKRFGCEPDYNVYLKESNTPPNSGVTLRSCGGHIHVGMENPNIETSERIVKAMDLFLGVPSIIMDLDSRRKEMYGKAGSFRFKDFGVEYRVLSNFWIESDELKEWVFNSTINAISYINNENNYKTLIGMSEEIVNCINSNNKELALKIISKIKQVEIINNKNINKKK